MHCSTQESVLRFLPQGQVEHLATTERCLRDDAAKAGEWVAASCQEKTLTALSEPLSPALHTLDLLVT